MLGKLQFSITAHSVRVDVENFRFHKQNAKINGRWHSHTGLEIIFLLDGDYAFDLEEDTLLIEAGQGILLPPRCLHRPHSTGSAYNRCGLTCAITPLNDDPEGQFLYRMLNEGAAWQFVLTPQMMEALRDCAREANEFRHGFISMIECEVLRLLWMIARVRDMEPLADYPLHVKHSLSMRTGEYIHDYIEKNASSGMTVSEAAKQAHLSTKQLQRIYQKEYGMTVHDHIALCRMQAAKKLLLDPDLSIGTIAVRLGFSSEQSFIRFYRQLDGQTPNAYRQGLLG